VTCRRCKVPMKEIKGHLGELQVVYRPATDDGAADGEEHGIGREERDSGCVRNFCGLRRLEDRRESGVLARNRR
jgi:hypothetical protein